jgi:hypothetical protein
MQHAEQSVLQAFNLFCNFHSSIANANQKLKEKTLSLKKTEMTYKKDESVFENIKKSLSKLEVFVLLGYFFHTLQFGCEQLL